jgi:predicted DNA-binding transcriptional regulator AlpA
MNGEKNTLDLTLDHLANDPAVIAKLSDDERRAIVIKLAGILAAVGGTMAAPQTTEPDVLLTVPEASAMTGLSPTYLYKHARQLPYYVPAANGARKVQFSRQGIQRYIAGRTRRPD